MNEDRRDPSQHIVGVVLGDGEVVDSGGLGPGGDGFDLDVGACGGA